jgi:hypothetical protein
MWKFGYDAICSSRKIRFATSTIDEESLAGYVDMLNVGEGFTRRKEKLAG